MAHHVKCYDHEMAPTRRSFETRHIYVEIDGHHTITFEIRGACLIVRGTAGQDTVLRPRPRDDSSLTQCSTTRSSDPRVAIVDEALGISDEQREALSRARDES